MIVIEIQIEIIMKLKFVTNASIFDFFSISKTSVSSNRLDRKCNLSYEPKLDFLSKADIQT